MKLFAVPVTGFTSEGQKTGFVLVQAKDEHEAAGLIGCLCDETFEKGSFFDIREVETTSESEIIFEHYEFC